MYRVLVCWTGVGEGRLAEKLKWITANHTLLEKTKGTCKVDYLAFCYHHRPIKLPKGIRIIYRRGIVFQFMYENLPPSYVSKYHFILLLLDDINLSPKFSLSEYIQIYRRNRLDVLQCALNRKTHISHGWMRASSRHRIGRLTNMAEYFLYLMSSRSYRKYYTTFLGPRIFWGWGIDINLGHVGRLKVGLLDCWPIWHRILGGSYRNSGHCPRAERRLWPYPKFRYLGGLR